MKNKIFFIILVVFVSFSCEGVLNVPNENSYDASIYFTDATTVAEATTATYGTLLTQGGWAWELPRLFNLIGYDAKKNFPLLARFQLDGDYAFDPTDAQIALVFGNFYRMIFRANFTIDLIDNLKITDAAKLADAARYKGEVEFLKALGNFYLVAGWGDVPLKKTLKDHYILQQGRTPAAEVWADIETTLLDAINRLPVSYSSASDYGRVTKGAAITLLGKAYLFQKKYTEAITQLSKLTAAPYDYTLTASLDNMFIFDQITKETIFPVVHGTWQGPGVADGRTPSRGQEENPGKTTSTGRPRDDSFNEWWNTLVSGPVVEACNYLDESGNPYHDPRAAKIFYDSNGNPAKWMGGDTTWCDQCAGGARSYPNFTAVNRKDGIYSWRKIQITEFSAVNSGQPSGDIDWQLLRYADVLMMLAESYIETNQVALALPLINQVRARSGAFQYTSLGTQAAARAIVRRDYTIEFAGENHRWYDLVRWGVLVNQINAEKLKYENFSPAKAYHVLLPIPQRERDANPVLNAQVKNNWN